MKIQKLLESKKLYDYVGNCVDSFDEDGQCILFNNYNDVTEFAYAEEISERLSKDNFLIHVENYPEIINNCDIFLYDIDNDVYIAYNSDTDIHYFFVK